MSTLSDKIQIWMDLYKMSPTLKLYENLYDTKAEAEAMVGSVNVNQLPNPIEVVLESLINMLSEKTSVSIITSSEDTVVVNNETLKEASQEIYEYLKDDTNIKLKLLHKAWLSELSNYLSDLLENEGNVKTDEVLYKVSNKFRIAGSSAIRAVQAI